MKYSLTILLSIISTITFSQTIDNNHLDKIKRNILSYRIFYLAKEIDSEYKFNNDCLLPPLDWELKLTNEAETLAFPKNKNYKFYRITNFNYSYFKFDTDNNIMLNNIGCGYIPFSDKFLVATYKDEILFISGMFFKDPISDFFELNKKEPLTFLNYLNIKLYNYNINGISFKKRKNKKMIFEGFISNKSDTVTIEVDSKNFDTVSIHYNNIKKNVFLK